MSEGTGRRRRNPDSRPRTKAAALTLRRLRRAAGPQARSWPKASPRLRTRARKPGRRDDGLRTDATAEPEKRKSQRQRGAASLWPRHRRPYAPGPHAAPGPPLAAGPPAICRQSARRSVPEGDCRTLICAMTRSRSEDKANGGSAEAAPAPSKVLARGLQRPTPRRPALAAPLRPRSQPAAFRAWRLRVGCLEQDGGARPPHARARARGPGRLPRRVRARGGHLPAPGRAGSGGGRARAVRGGAGPWESAAGRPGGGGEAPGPLTQEAAATSPEAAARARVSRVCSALRAPGGFSAPPAPAKPAAHAAPRREPGGRAGAAPSPEAAPLL